MSIAEPGVLLVDDRRIFLAANDEAGRILGTPVAELLGRRTDEFMPMVARALYPLAWRAFLLRGNASGEYAAELPDGGKSHMAYVGFANRPIRGLHFFVLESLPGQLDEAHLAPRMQSDSVQYGPELDDTLRERLTREAARQEWKLPVGRGGNRAVLAALFSTPRPALEALAAIRALPSVEASLASVAGSEAAGMTTLLAGRVPYAHLGDAAATIRANGGRITSNLDESIVWRQPPAAGG